MLKRRCNHDRVVALVVIPLSRDGGDAKGLRLQFCAILLLALRFQGHRVSVRLVATVGTQMGSCDAVGLTLATHPRGVKAQASECLDDFNLQSVLIVPSVP